MNKLSLVNEILSKNRLGYASSLNDSFLSQFPFNNLFHLIDESINIFSREQTWNWKKEITDLEYFEPIKSYSLADFNIDYNKINKIFFFEGNNKPEIKRVSKEYFRNYYEGQEKEGKPQFYCIEEGKLTFHPIPDKDYGIKVSHYEQIELPIIETHEVEDIPDEYQEPIVNFVSTIFNAILDKKVANDVIEEYIESLSEVKSTNQGYLTHQDIAPSGIRW